MEDLTNQKLKEEIAKLKTERHSIQFNTAFEFVKTALIFIGGIFVFFLIQSPESILKRQSSKEQISSARFTIIQAILDETDEVKQQQLFSALKAVYSDNDNWVENLKFIESQESQELLLDAVGKLSNNEQLNKLIEEKQNLLKELRIQYEKEIRGEGISGQPGFGLVARGLREQIEALNAEISELLQYISSEN
ncbi:MAG: hypothetical protein AAFQ80_07130 [Cyanobacteria bacterium J06621_8]